MEIDTTTTNELHTEVKMKVEATARIGLTTKIDPILTIGPPMAKADNMATTNKANSAHQTTDKIKWRELQAALETHRTTHTNR